MESKRLLLAAVAAVIVVGLGVFSVAQLLSSPLDRSPVPQLTPAGAASLTGRPPVAAEPPGTRVAPGPERGTPAPAAESAPSAVVPTVKPDRSTADVRSDDKNDRGERPHGDGPRGDRPHGDRGDGGRDGREDRRDRDDPGRRGDRDRPSSSAPAAPPGGLTQPAAGTPGQPPAGTPGQPPAGTPGQGAVDPATGLPARAPSGEPWVGPPGETPEQRKARLGRELALAFCDKNKIPRDRCHPPR